MGGCDGDGYQPGISGGFALFRHVDQRNDPCRVAIPVHAAFDVGSPVGNGEFIHERGGQFNHRDGAWGPWRRIAGKPGFRGNERDEIYVPVAGRQFMVVSALYDPVDNEFPGGHYERQRQQRGGWNECRDGDGPDGRRAERGANLRQVDHQRICEQRAGAGLAVRGDGDVCHSGTTQRTDGQILRSDQHDARGGDIKQLRLVHAAGKRQRRDQLFLSRGGNRACAGELLALSDERGAGGGDDEKPDEPDAVQRDVRVRGAGCSTEGLRTGDGRRTR